MLTWAYVGNAGLPRARDLAALRRADGAEPAEHAGRHGVLLPQLPGDGVGGALPGPGLGHLLPRRLRLHLHGQHHHPARGRGRTTSPVPPPLHPWMPLSRRQHLPLHFRQRPEAEVLLYAVLVRRVLTSLRRSGARSGPSGPYLATTYL